MVIPPLWRVPAHVSESGDTCSSSRRSRSHRTRCSSESSLGSASSPVAVESCAACGRRKSAYRAWGSGSGAGSVGDSRSFRCTNAVNSAGDIRPCRCHCAGSCRAAASRSARDEMPAAVRVICGVIIELPAPHRRKRTRCCRHRRTTLGRSAGVFAQQQPAPETREFSFSETVDPIGRTHPSPERRSVGRERHTAVANSFTCLPSSVSLAASVTEVGLNNDASVVASVPLSLLRQRRLPALQPRQLLLGRPQHPL
jgi:hypothetical protein